MCETDYRASLESQIRDAYGKVVYTYTTFLKMANRLSCLNKRIKTLQIVLSAVSTVGLFSTIFIDEMLIKICSTVASSGLLGITLYCKDFHLAEDTRQFTMGSDELWIVREEYLSLLTDMQMMPTDDIVHKRDELTKQVAAIYKKYPKTDSKSYTEAQKALKHEEEQFFRDSEIDQMLPKHLRRNQSECS